MGFMKPNGDKTQRPKSLSCLDELRASRPVEKVLVKTPAEPRSTELELEMRKKRKKRMRKLEKSQEKKEKKTNRLIETTPGRRIYQLPNRIRPVSLFVRIGAVNTDEDYIQQEYYDLISSESGAESISPHPAAVEMRDLFHLIEERSPKVANLDEYADELGNKVPKMRPRPQSVQFPLVSAMKKTSNGVASTSEVKRKSLRFLDPKDMKLYEAISHARTPEEGRLETEKRTQGDDNDPLLSNIESLNLDQQ